MNFKVPLQELSLCEPLLITTSGLESHIAVANLQVVRANGKLHAGLFS